MVFWRKEDKSKPAGDPQALVARREYDAAIKAYRDLIAAKPGQYMLHHKVADVFCLAGRQSEAMADYGKAAEGYARDGYLIKAAAILKKMQKIEPANAGVARRLADLGQLGSSTGGAPVAAKPEFAQGPEISFDMEEIEEPAAPAPVPPRERASIPVSPMETPKAPPAPAPIPAAAAGKPGAGRATGESQGGPPAMARTPLFSDFSPAELSDVLARLRHHSFPAGDAVVREGEPGESLFVISQGSVRVIGTGPGGKPIELAVLGEGDFFGEVALLTGKPRTATILCEEDTDLLELTRSDLSELESRYPRVREVIEDFYEQRVESTVESMLDAVRLPDPE